MLHRIPPSLELRTTPAKSKLLLYSNYEAKFFFSVTGFDVWYHTNYCATFAVGVATEKRCFFNHSPEKQRYDAKYITYIVDHGLTSGAQSVSRRFAMTCIARRYSFVTF